MQRGKKCLPGVLRNAAMAAKAPGRGWEPPACRQ